MAVVMDDVDYVESVAKQHVAGREWLLIFASSIDLKSAHCPTLLNKRCFEYCNR